MAIGDVTQKKLLQKALTTTPANSQITGAAGKVNTITSISLKLQNGATTKRTVTCYIYGTAATNELFTLEIDPYGVKSEILSGLDYVLAAGETMCFKQDAGTDVNIAVMGIEEVIS